ncbi:hypothetical protein AB0D12_39415 [Streptomyces sp. NPDC048479]|uniref:hypothetical protein n=1 Tax=Streptomyces sp. NPDC048479 TaxID=3154725 RepID=UPI003433A530
MKADFTFTRTLRLDGTDSFTEPLTIEGVNIPDDFDRGISLSAFNGHICQGSCKPIEPQGGDWTAPPTWKPGDTHGASLTAKYTWDVTAVNMKYWFKPDVKIEGQVHSPGMVQKVDYQWSKGYWQDTPDLDQIRCDTLTTHTATGSVFVNSAPTYVFNAKKHPQAAAHAWLIQTMLPNHAGAESYGKPLYYMGNSDQNATNRGRICPKGWAAANSDAGALDDANDALNCDEFAFASSYNSGGMKKSEGSLNEAVPTGTTTGDPDGEGLRAVLRQEARDEHLPVQHRQRQGADVQRGVRALVHLRQSEPAVDGRELQQLHAADAHHRQGRLGARYLHDRELRGHRRVRQAGEARGLHDDRKVAANT